MSRKDHHSINNLVASTPSKWEKSWNPYYWAEKVSLIVALLQSSISEQGLSILSADIKGTESTHENKAIKLDKNDNRQKEQA